MSYRSCLSALTGEAADAAQVFITALSAHHSTGASVWGRALGLPNPRTAIGVSRMPGILSSFRANRRGYASPTFI
jgi:hypothetical protein